MKKQRRRPTRVVYTRTVYYGGRPRSRRKWNWLVIGGLLTAFLLFQSQPGLSMLIVTVIAFYLAKKRYGSIRR